MFFFFNDTATTEIYTLSLHDALPILTLAPSTAGFPTTVSPFSFPNKRTWSKSIVESTSAVNFSTYNTSPSRSEEHTSELQSRQYIVCRLLLENKINSMTPSVLSNIDL